MLSLAENDASIICVYQKAKGTGAQQRCISALLKGGISSFLCKSGNTRTRLS